MRRLVIRWGKSLKIAAYCELQGMPYKKNLTSFDSLMTLSLYLVVDRLYNNFFVENIIM